MNVKMDTPCHTPVTDTGSRPLCTLWLRLPILWILHTPSPTTPSSSLRFTCRGTQPSRGGVLFPRAPHVRRVPALLAAGGAGPVVFLRAPVSSLSILRGASPRSSLSSRHVPWDRCVGPPTCRCLKPWAGLGSGTGSGDQAGVLAQAGEVGHTQDAGSLPPGEPGSAGGVGGAGR